MPVSNPPTAVSAARLLSQAGFGATTEQITRLQMLGVDGWLGEQFALASNQSNFEWMQQNGYAAVAHRNDFGGVDNTIWRKLISSQDVLRQRVVLALSEIFVVSMAGVPVSWRGMAIAAYLDMLEAKAFTSYREILGAVTLSNAMGVYLNLRGNQKEDPRTGRLPDENYAREVLQLFSIGLYELNLDGTPRLVNGKPVETYTLSTVTELARVFTGWDFDGADANDPSYMLRPMVHIASRFSPGDKKLLGVTIPASANGPQALQMALDTIAGHPNVSPFISRQLIQRLVTSNPSPAYVRRVASVFNNNGSGQRGDMKSVLRAILTDAEASTPASAAGAGKLREPVLRFVQWARLAGLTSPTGLWNVGDLSDSATRLGQSPMRSPTVFNFFRPAYVPPNSAMAANGVTAPEFQLLNETTIAGYLNFMQNAITNGVGELKPNYAPFDAIAANPSQLVAQLALLLAGDGIGASTQSAISAAVASIPAAGTTAATGRLNRIRAALLLLMACPEYLIQK